VAFICRHQVTGQVLAVDTRYFDPEANGGQKTGSQGEKAGVPWCSDWRRIAAAHTVYIYESAINALSHESCVLPGTAAIATRGTGNVSLIDWSFLRGKQVRDLHGQRRAGGQRAEAGLCAGPGGRVASCTRS
jgi:hypothetical protein